MDTVIKDMKVKIEQLKTTFCEKGIEVEEECPDVIESEIAMMEVMKEVYISAIVEEEPEGEA